MADNCVVYGTDTASDPGKALAAGQGLVQSNGAFAILNGNSLSAPLPYLVQNNIPTFDVLTDSPLMSSAKNLFTTEGAWDPATGGTLTAPLFAKFLQSQGVTTMAIFDSGSQSGLAGTKATSPGLPSWGSRPCTRRRGVVGFLRRHERGAAGEAGASGRPGVPVGAGGVIRSIRRRRNRGTRQRSP